jgi:superkiller protein 3
LFLDPNYTEAYNNIGLALYKMGRVDEAIIQYQKAVATDPNYAEAYYNLGLALYKMGRVDEAIASAQRALQLAIAQNNTSLVNAIQKQIKFYQARSPLNDDSLTNTPAHLSHP